MNVHSRNLLQLLIGLLFLMGQAPGVYEVTVPSAGASPSLESLLQPDSIPNLQTEFSGSLDPRGWQLLSGPGQPPSFVRDNDPVEATALTGPQLPSVAGDEYWDDRFDVLGVSGYVRAIAVSGSSVFVGGNFSSVGGVSANSIARWDSATGAWSALGDGIPGYVYAIAVAGRYVYVGGSFNAIGGTPSVPGTQSIARWDTLTNTWSALSGGVHGYVFAIAVDHDDVYVGGYFNVVGDYPFIPGTQAVARWNALTGAWSALSSGIPGYVYSIAISGEDVYVGGQFNAVGGYAPVPGTQSIALWNTMTHTWSALGSGIPGYVYAIAVDGQGVYVGGVFNSVGGNSSVQGTLSIARWNPAAKTWSALGSGIPGIIYAITINGDDIYVGGLFNAVGGSPSVPNTRNIARWNTTSQTWSALGSGVNAHVFALGVGDGLYAGGLFILAGDKSSLRFGRWFGFVPAPPPPPPPPPPFTGSISGMVWAEDTEYGVENALVQVCPSAGGACIWTGLTDSNGEFMASDLPDGEYQVTAYPPASVCWLPGTAGPITITNGRSITEIFIVLKVCPVEPPPGTRISPSTIGDSGGTIINWRDTLDLETSGCVGGSAFYEIVQGVDILSNGPMTEGPAGVYHATILPLHPAHGRAEIHITIACPDGSSQDTIFDIYIDPSGTVETIHGTPVVSATVTLMYLDDGIGDFTDVPNGDAAMSPDNRNNPDFTDKNGHFGWDVVAGFYIVRAEKSGCVAPFDPSHAYVETDVLVVPPAITDLDLLLDCGERVIYLPLVQQ